jgi:hypothetical protein
MFWFRDDPGSWSKPRASGCLAEEREGMCWTWGARGEPEWVSFSSQGIFHLDLGWKSRWDGEGTEVTSFCEFKILDFGRDREAQEGMSQVTLRNSEGRPKYVIRIQTRDSGMDRATGQNEKQCGVDFATDSEPSHSTLNIQLGCLFLPLFPSCCFGAYGICETLYVTSVS